MLEDSRWHVLWHPELVHQWEQQDPIDKLAVWAESPVSAAPSQVLLFDAHMAHRNLRTHFVNQMYQRIPDWYEKIASSLSRVFPSLKGVKVEMGDVPAWQEGKTGYIRFPGKAPVAVDHLDDGVRHTFKLLASLIALVESNQPGMFLWEYPELFMYPTNLGRMLEEVFRLIANAPVRVFVSTQSLEVLAWLIRSIREKTLPIPVSDLRTCRLRLDGDLLKAGTLIGEGVANWFELTGDPRIVDEDEMDSPLAWLFYHTEAAE